MPERPVAHAEGRHFRALLFDVACAMYQPVLAGSPLTINLQRFVGPMSASWYDPVSGATTTVAGSPFSNAASRNFTPSGNNAEGSGDWVLLLQSAP